MSRTTPAARRYAVDTNLYIDAMQTEAGKIALGQFMWGFTPWIHLCAVVAQELRAGVRGSAARALDLIDVAVVQRG